MWRWLFCGLVSCCVLCTARPALAREKTDTVWTDRGDQVICEVLGLTQGRLSVKSNDMGTLSIDWKHVAGVHSRFYYRVRPAWGGRYFGSFSLDVGKQTFLVCRASDSISFHRLDVVEIEPIERSFWSRLEGSFSLGFSYTKANNVAQLTLSWANRYTMENDLIDLKASTLATVVRTGDSGDSLSRNEDFTLTYYHLFRKRLNVSTSASYQRNDELGLKHRAIVSLTGGVNPITTNLHTLLVSLGVALNSELGTSDTSVTKESAEGVVRANYSLFQYTSPKTNLNATLAYYPSLTESERQRLDFNLKFSHELVKDFFLDISYYTNIDSRPATQDASTTDFGLVTSISWTY